MLLPNATAGEAQTLATGLLEAVRDACGVSLGDGRRASASIGVTGFHQPDKDLTADDILVDADDAMYAAKEAGKDRVVVASAAAHERMRTRVTWAERVRRAVREGVFALHCQPIVDLTCDTVSQWELLLRLPAEGDELILPSQFLYTAERSGLIFEIDRWVLGEAMRLIAEQRDAGRDVRLEVNISGRSVSRSPRPPRSRTWTAPEASRPSCRRSAAGSHSMTSAPASAPSTISSTSRSIT